LRAASAVELKLRIELERNGSPFLIYRDGAGAQRLVALDAQHPALGIGRQESLEISIEWDPEVSRVHAALERVGVEWTLVDYGSARNGTFVNGERLHGRRRLKDGDLIRAGSTTIAFLSPQARSPSQATVTGQDGDGPQLSDAQRRVLVALCRPLLTGRYGVPASNQEIARELIVGVETVKSHVRALFEAFGIADLPQNRKRAELARQAIERGAVSDDDIAA
jgi:DNA-binding CsgD family transcriptional regulator